MSTQSADPCAIKPIPTEYNGVRFRSRLEARWAYFFDLEKIDWEYEREGYQLPSGWYVPDFWLPQVGMWAEVKPSTFSGIERLRCDELARVTEFPVILLAGAPSNIAYEILDHAGRYMDRVCSINGGYLDERRFWACNSAEAEERLNDDTETHKAAKAHRFDWRSH